MRRKVGIWFYTNENGHVIRQEIVQRLEESDIQVIYDFDMRECYCLNGNVYTKDSENLSELDLLFYMNMEERSPHQTDILRALETSGVRIVNSFESYSKANDKFIANMILRRNGIKVPDSMLIPTNFSEKVMREVFDKWGAVVVKPRNGVCAYGVMKFDDFEPFFDFMLYAQASVDNLYIEKKVNFKTRDMRVEIFDGKVVGDGFSRVMKHSFKTNVRAGGVATYIPAEQDAKETALAAAKAIGITATIVDMVRCLDDGKPYVLEVNQFLGVFYGEYHRSIGQTPPEYFRQQDRKKVDLIVDYIKNVIEV